MNPGPVQEQRLLLTTEPSFQSFALSFGPGGKLASSFTISHMEVTSFPGYLLKRLFFLFNFFLDHPHGLCFPWLGFFLGILFHLCDYCECSSFPEIFHSTFVVGVQEGN